MFAGLNTDYLSGTGSPERWLRLIAEAGFTHLHWCHQWDTDFLYSRHEIAQYRSWLKTFGLKLLDIHGSAGAEKVWFSPEEYVRRAGVELVLNRVLMFAELEGTGSLIMHIPAQRDGNRDSAEDRALCRREFEALKRSLDELMPELAKYHVRIAVENMWWDSFEYIGELMELYPEEYLGITYDSGHGNFEAPRGLEHIERWKHRLQALHLNDNHGGGDLHQPPYYGTVDWDRMAGIIAGSSYPEDRPLSFELSMRCTQFFNGELPEQPEAEIRKFLLDARERCERVIRLTEQKRSARRL